MFLESDTWDEVALMPTAQTISTLMNSEMGDSASQDASQQQLSKGDILTTRDYQQLLLGLCLKPETEVTLEKLMTMVREQSLRDSSFILFISDDKCTPLHYACRANNTRTATFLIEETTVKVTCRDESDRIALHYAVANQNQKIIRLLMQRCPARVVTHAKYGRDEDTLLHDVVKADRDPHAAMVGWFVCQGADPLTPNRHGITPYDIARQRKGCSFYYLNGYLLERTVFEDRANITADEIDDDLVRVRRKPGQPITLEDGYTPSERLLVKMNAKWWDYGKSSTLDFCLDYVTPFDSGFV